MLIIIPKHGDTEHVCAVLSLSFLLIKTLHVTLRIALHTLNCSSLVAAENKDFTQHCIYQDTVAISAVTTAGYIPGLKGLYSTLPLAHTLTSFYVFDFWDLDMSLLVPSKHACRDLSCCFSVLAPQPPLPNFTLYGHSIPSSVV